MFPGYYCPNNTQFAAEFACPNGTFNNMTKGVSQNACEQCTPGYYCPSPGLAEPAGTCAPGWYCTLGSWSTKPTIMGNDTGSSCECPMLTMGGKCYAATYCPAGSSAPIPCDPGKYCYNDELYAVSGDCMAGYYCNGSTILPNPVNETTGDICPKGHYCPTASAFPIPCGPGYYSNRFSNHNDSNCLNCTAGMYCSGYGRALPDGDCDIGWYCPEAMTVPQPLGKQCLAGHACPQGSATQIPCPSGQYQPIVQQGVCLECPAGMYCDQNEAIAEQQSGAGEASHGVVTPKACPMGFNCPNGTETVRQFPCPVGTYSNSTHLESEAQCRLCPEGFYCEAENITEPTGMCSAGYHCVLGATTPTPSVSVTGGPCPQGTYCQQGWTYPTPCPKGTFGDRAILPSEADCTICPPGDFCSHSGLTASNGSCLAGYYCTNASEEANPLNKVYGDECPVGHYCRESSYMPTACPAGTYQPFTRMTNDSSCLACDGGSYCNASGQSATSGLCKPGFYCVSGATSPSPQDGVTGNICPAGSYCPEGSYYHLYCANGTYTNHTGAAYCYDCPEGYYCVNRDSADLCPRGYYCPLNTGADLQPCPSGTYNPTLGIRNVTECTQCDGGMFCLIPGLSTPSGSCSAGYYCTSGDTRYLA